MATNVYQSSNPKDNEERSFKADQDGNVARNICSPQLADILVALETSNVAPNNILLSNNNIPDGSIVGTTVGILSTADADLPSDSHTYSIILDVGNKFVTAGNLLQISNPVNIVDVSYDVTIRTTDQEGLFYDKVFTIIIIGGSTFINNYATRFVGNALNMHMRGKATDSILPGQGSFTLNAWVKNDNPVFSPTDINDIHLWLDANDDSTIIEVSGAISQWDDKSGNGFDLLQATSGSRPLKNISALASKNTVLFDGVDDFMETNIPLSLDQMTVFIVSRFNQLNQGAADFDYLYSYGSATANNLMSLARRDSGANADSYYLYDGGDTLNGPVLTGQEFQTHVQRINNVAPFHQYFQNGVAQTVTDNDVAFSVTGAFNLGRYTAGTHFLDGDIAEVIIYSRSLTNLERQDVESYLDAKWNGSVVSSPLDIPNLGLWLDADDSGTIIESAGVISQWNDKSGNGNNAIPDTIGERPTLTPSGYGARNTINFDATKSLTTTYNAAANRTIFTVFRHDMDGAAPVGPLWQENGASSSSGFFPSFSDGIQYLRYGSNWMSQPTTFLQSVNYITSAVYNPAGNSLELYSNGTLNDSSICDIGVGDGFVIGKRQTTSSFYVGEIAEIIIYDRALTTIERQDIENYLNSKWVLGINPAFTELKTVYSIKQSVVGGLVKAQVLWNEQNRLVAEVYDAATFSMKSVEAIGNFADNIYKMVTLEYDVLSSTATLYVNALPVGSFTVVAPNSGDGLLTVASNFELSPFLDGFMDEFSFWNNKIDITELYANGTSFDLNNHSDIAFLVQWNRLGDPPDDYILLDGITDRSGNNNHLTAINMTVSNRVSDAVPQFQAFEDLLSLPFNGIDQRVLQPSTGMEFEATDPFSISVWLKYNSSGATATIIGNMYNSNGGVAPNFQGYRLRNIATGIISFQFIANNGASFTQMTGQIDTALSINVWYNVCATYDGSDDASGISFYINGSLVASSQPVNDNLNGSISHSNGISYGSRPDNTPTSPIQFFDGKLNEPAIWDKELTPAEVTEIYNGGVPGDLNAHSAVSNLRSWLGCGDVSGDSNLILKDRTEQVADATMFNYGLSPFDSDVP